MGYISEHPQTNLSIIEFYQRLGYKYKDWLSEFNKYEEMIRTVVIGGETVPYLIQPNYSIHNFDFSIATSLFTREIEEQFLIQENVVNNSTGKPDIVSYTWIDEFPKHWDIIYTPQPWVYCGEDEGRPVIYALDLLPEYLEYWLDYPGNPFDMVELEGYFYERIIEHTIWNVPPLEKYIEWMYGSFYGQIDPPQYNYWNCIDIAVRMQYIKRRRRYNALGELESDEYITPPWVTNVDEEIERLDRVYRGEPSYGAVRYLGVTDSTTRFNVWYYSNGGNEENPPYREYEGYWLYDEYRAYWMTGHLDTDWYGSIIDRLVNVHMDIDAIT